MSSLLQILPWAARLLFKALSSDFYEARVSRSRALDENSSSDRGSSGIRGGSPMPVIEWLSNIWELVGRNKYIRIIAEQSGNVVHWCKSYTGIFMFS